MGAALDVKEKEVITRALDGIFMSLEVKDHSFSKSYEIILAFFRRCLEFLILIPRPGR